MVGRLTLDQEAEVRTLHPQPIASPPESRGIGQPAISTLLGLLPTIGVSAAEVIVLSIPELRQAWSGRLR